MLLERTISQLDIGPLAPDEAIELAQLGYIQWLEGLPRESDFQRAAMRAYQMARPFRQASPAIAVFCDLLIISAIHTPHPLPLQMPVARRRGGARARRLRGTMI